METFHRIAKVNFQTSPGPHRKALLGDRPPPTLCGHSSGAAASPEGIHCPQGPLVRGFGR